MDQKLRTEDEENLVASNNNNVISSQASKVSKQNKPARKLQNLSTRISSATHKKFKQFVLNKHGKINGPYSQEVEYALEFYMNNQQQTTSSPITSMRGLKNRPRKDVLANYIAIARELKRLDNFPYLNAPTIKSVVSRTFGKRDERTHKKYLDAIRKLSKEEYVNSRLGVLPLFDVTRFVEKILSDDW